MTEINDDVVLHVVARVTDLMTSRGMRAAELARRANLPRATVYRSLRSEQTLTPAQIWALADGLGVSPARLLPLDGPAIGPHEAAVITALRSGDPIALSKALDDAGAQLRTLTAHEAAVIAAIRSGDPAVAAAELAEAMGVPVAQIAGPLANPEVSPLAPARLREVGAAAADVGDAAQRLAAAIDRAVEPER